MKHYILVYVEKPADVEKHPEDKYWSNLQQGLQDTNRPSEGLRRIGENCWLLDRESAASALACIVSFCERSHLIYRVRYLSSDD